MRVAMWELMSESKTYGWVVRVLHFWMGSILFLARNSWNTMSILSTFVQLEVRSCYWGWFSLYKWGCTWRDLLRDKGCTSALNFNLRLILSGAKSVPSWWQAPVPSPPLCKLIIWFICVFVTKSKKLSNIFFEHFSGNHIYMIWFIWYDLYDSGHPQN